MADRPLDLVIKNVRVVRPGQPRVERLDLGVAGGRFARVAPDIATSCLTIDSAGMNTVQADASGASPWHAGLRAADHGGSLPRLVKAAGCETWSPFWRNLTPALVDEAHALGLRVLPWTVNEPADMARLMDARVDGIITDYPDRLRGVLRARGMASP